MTRRIVTSALFVAVTLGVAGLADATSRYKRAVYKTRVHRGVTQVQARFRGGWGARWIPVAVRGSRVIQERASGVGPVFVVRNANGTHSIKGLNWKTGARWWAKSTGRRRPVILSAGRYGVRFKVGKRYYSTHRGRVRGPFRR